MLEQELLMDCPFCEKAKVKVRHKPSIVLRKRKVSSTMGVKYNTQESKEVYDVLEDCPNCHKTKEEIKKTIDRRQTYG